MGTELRSQPAERSAYPSSPSLPSLAAAQPPVARQPLRLQLLNPLHAGPLGPLEQQLRAVMEVALRMRYHSGDDGASLDLDSVEGVRGFLQSNPSLGWAMPHAKSLYKLLHQQKGLCKGHVPAGELLPERESSRVASPSGLCMRRSRSASMVMRLPPMCGGGAAAAAVTLIKNERRADLAEAATAKLSGVDPASAANLAARLEQLAPTREGTIAWLIVETCRDCHLHGASFQHDERVFAARFEKLRAAINACFPEGIAVETLVPMDECRDKCRKSLYARSTTARLAASSGPPVRIGAFEVFLCVAQPLMPLGAVPLECPFSALALASRLTTLKWTEADEVLRRLVRALPTLPFQVSIKTAEGFPVPRVRVAATPLQEALQQGPARQGGGEVFFAGETDANGQCQILVPVCVQLCLEASHELLMRPQQRELPLAAGVEAPSPQEFVAETVVQLWCQVDGAELLVFCLCPRTSLASDAHWQIPRCEPFQGLLEHRTLGKLRPDQNGCLRGDPGFLDGVRSVLCVGWQKAKFIPATHADAAQQEPGAYALVARLPAATVEACLVTGCCMAPLPGARISIDGALVGTTSEQGEAVSVAVTVAEHSIQVDHLLAERQLAVPCVVAKPRLCRAQIKLSPERLRFVCVGGTGASQGPFADLWLVGGSLQDWQDSLRGPPKSSELWLWDGDLTTPSGDPLLVRTGALTTPCVSADEGDACPLATALALPVGPPGGEWRVAMHGKAGPGACPLSLLARQRDLGMPGFWLARLAPTTRQERSRQSPQAKDQAKLPESLRLGFRSACCGCLAFPDAYAIVGGQRFCRTANDFFELPRSCAEEPLDIEIGGIPRCLLPGQTLHYSCPVGSPSVELDVPCAIWLYWIPPEKEDAELEVDLKEENPIFATSNEDHVPATARPLAGILECLGTERAEIQLDGNCIGPFPLQPALGDLGAEAPPCLLGRLSLKLKAPAGFLHHPKEQCAGPEDGCQLARLASEAIKMGSFRPLPAPAPHNISFHSACCGRRFCGAKVAADGLSATPMSCETIYRLPQPRWKRSRGHGDIHLQVDGVPSCLLPRGSRSMIARFGPSEPELLPLKVSCSLFMFWMPHTEEDDPFKTAMVIEEEVTDSLQGRLMRPLMVTADAEQVPLGARPVQGVLECASAIPREQKLSGHSVGPFTLSAAQGAASAQDPDAAPCLLSQVSLSISPPPGYEHRMLSETPFRRRCEQEGGCELHRLAGESPIEVGHLELLPTPMLTIHLNTRCCGGPFCGSSAIINGGGRSSLGDMGRLRLRRARKGGRLEVQLEEVPLALLPDQHSRVLVEYGPTEPSVIQLDVLCLLWVYWIPPDDFEVSEEEPDAEEPAGGQIFITANPDQIPEGARPVAGSIEWPAGSTRIELDGQTVGPFEGPLAAEDGGPCPVAEARFMLDAPIGFEFVVREPSPLQERVAHLGGCELDRLAKCPAAIGSFLPVAPPNPLRVAVRSACCGRGFAGAQVTIDGLPVRPTDVEGCHWVPHLRRKRRARTGTLAMQIQGVPEGVLELDAPSEAEGRYIVPYGLSQPESLNVGLVCQLWMYWVEYTECESDSEGEPASAPYGTVFVAAVPSHVPENARPLSGLLECANASLHRLVLDGNMTGPFPVYPAQELADSGSSSCLLRQLSLNLRSPELFECKPIVPSPLAARCDELGGCELHRLLQAPVAMANMIAITIPRLPISIRTGCCGTCWPGSTLSLNGREATSASDGPVELRRRRRGGTLTARIGGVPEQLLPLGLDGEVSFSTYTAIEPKSVDLTMSCPIFVYWIPPEVEPDGTEFGVGEEPEGGFVFVAVSASQVPKEALPIRGIIICPGAQEHLTELPGDTTGPFHLRPERGANIEPAECFLGGLSIQMQDAQMPDRFTYEEEKPPAFAKRFEELGGCELQRLLEGPVAVGFMRPTPTEPLELRLVTGCCNCCFAGSKLAINGRAGIETDEDGSVILRRRRDGGELEVQVEGVPSQFLTELAPKHTYDVDGPSVMQLELGCPLWIYWIPPEEGDADDEGGLDEEGFVFLAADGDQVPEEAKPVVGWLGCPGASEIELDGTSTGPFQLRRAKAFSAEDNQMCDMVENNRSISDARILQRDISMRGVARQTLHREEDTEASSLCLVAKLELRAKAPDGFGYHGKSPSPLRERCMDLGDCELQRLLSCPICIATYKPLPPPPPLSLSLHMSCCTRGFPGVCLSVDGQATKEDEENPGFHWIPQPRRRRKARDGLLNFEVKSGLSEWLLPDQRTSWSARYGDGEPEALELNLGCPLWVYWVPMPGDDDSDEEAPPQSPSSSRAISIQNAAGGLLFVAAVEDQVAEEAHPVKGQLVWKDGSIDLEGESTGPFWLKPAGGQAAALEECLLAGLQVRMQPPALFQYEPRDPAPLAERCAELGGCELQRLLQCPIVIGDVRPIPLAPLRVTLQTCCCNCPFEGATVALGSRKPVPFDESGCAEFKRSRQSGEAQVKVEGVPSQLMGQQPLIKYTPFEPDDAVCVKVFCPVWVYWVPMEEDEEDSDEDAGEEAQTAAATGMVFIAASEEQVAEEALPVRGKLVWEDGGLALDGESTGPFWLERAEGEMPGPAECLLASLKVQMEPPSLFDYECREPGPMAERCAELGGCELQRLLQCPVVVGHVRPIPLAPLRVTLQTCCCGRPFEGATVALGSRKAVQFNELGCANFKRRRQSGEAQVTIQGVPSQLIGPQPLIEYTPFEPQYPVSVEAFCPLWVYWVPPDDDEEEGGDEDACEEAQMAAATGLVFIAADKEQVPDDAEPLCGLLQCPGSRQGQVALDGSSMGPIFLSKDSDFASGPADMCLLAGLTVQVEAPEGWRYQGRDPSTLAERCRELGGCELQRLATCPLVVGDLKPVKLPPFRLSLRTACCSRSWEGACCSVNGRETEPFGESGCLQLTRRRRGGVMKAHIEGVPTHLLTGGSCEVTSSYTAFDPPRGMGLEVLCPIWVYYVPPEEEEEEELEEGEEPMPPPEAMVFLAVDPAHVDPEALPIGGAIDCPGAEASILLDGVSTGPFYVRALPASPSHQPDGQDCLLGKLSFNLAAPLGHSIRYKDPSPLQERCQELGGCELQRLTQCPAVVGFLKPSGLPGAPQGAPSEAESDDP